MDPTNPLVPDAFGLFWVFFAVCALLVGVGFIVVIVLIVRNASKASRAGYDPTTLSTDLATRALDSEMLRPAAPPRSAEQRLAEVEDLHARGVISAEERTAARAAIIGG